MSIARGQLTQLTATSREHLGVAAAGRPALDAEHRPERRLPDGDERVLAELVERLPESDRRHRLALTQRRRRHPRDQYEFGVLGALPVDALDGVELYLRLVLAEQLQVLPPQSERRDHVRDV